jgi:hypothetical protein
MTACRSAGLSELTSSSVVGLADGEGDERAGGVAGALDLFPETGAGLGVCAGEFIVRKRPIKTDDVNRCI